MKKITVLLLCILAITAAPVQAQEDARFGVRVSWDLNSPSTNLNDYVDVYGNGSGFSLGAFYDIPLYKSLYFEPGLSFFYNTIGIPDISVASSPSSSVLVSGSLRNVGFRVPLVAAYRFDFTDDIGLSVFTGPQLNVGLSMKAHLNLPDGLKGTVESSEQLYGEGWHRLDMQWLFGVRLHYADNFMAEISGGPGMTNLMGGKEYEGSHLRRNIFSIGVGYIF